MLFVDKEKIFFFFAMSNNDRGLSVQKRKKKNANYREGEGEWVSGGGGERTHAQRVQFKLHGVAVIGEVHTHIQSFEAMLLFFKKNCLINLDHLTTESSASTTTKLSVASYFVVRSAIFFGTHHSLIHRMSNSPRGTGSHFCTKYFLFVDKITPGPIFFFSFCIPRSKRLQARPANRLHPTFALCCEYFFDKLSE